jgi:hypothetical protein
MKYAKWVLFVALSAGAAVGFALPYCGVPPVPPVGCEPVCVCDEGGDDCHWTFEC